MENPANCGRIGALRVRLCVGGMYILYACNSLYSGYIMNELVKFQ